ncbi:hypothetical protein PHSC3_000353 [Chlamydiales bacterium STE3]|nr:hypothetical protein PHSC3_000353 [Chlamydiales bacterium STE3]
MSTLALTLTFSFVIVLIAICSLAIGWLITGKSKIKGGMCGKVPGKKEDNEECNTSISCDLCTRQQDTKNDQL